MEKNILFTLLHDVWGEGTNESLRLSMSRLDGETLAQSDAAALSKQVPEVPLERWQAWCNYFSPERYGLREKLLDDLGVRILLFCDEDYPPSLKNIYRPPAVLYVKGHLPEVSRLSIGIVGSRKATAYGKNVAYTMAKALSEEGCCIISGLAKGIDGNAHQGAIEARGGTIAVLGCGIDKVYPRANEQIYAAILAHPDGAIISEWPLGAAALSWHFPQRNRIIAGLSEGVLVVEAAKKSGSLITASLALELGKEVFAIPGLITSPESVGCHRLIKDGAKLVAQPSDILDEFGQLNLFNEVKPLEVASHLTPEQRKVYEALTGVPQGVEEICLLTKLPVNTVNTVLLELELEDLVIQDYGRQYSKA